jgi:hypothetical protein
MIEAAASRHHEVNQHDGNYRKNRLSIASTVQICPPYAGVEKERRCGVALSGLNLGATANALTARDTLWRAFLKFGANLLRAFDPMERCPSGSASFAKEAQPALFSNG